MEVFLHARQLPDEWDVICEHNYALKKDFLHYMELTNPCSQRYYLFRDQNQKIDSIFMTFKKKKHNLSMFAKFNFYVDVTMIYVPLSIANCALILGENTKSEVEKAIKKIKGCKLILNLKEDIGFKNVSFGLTCSNIIFDLKWTSFDDYIASLRSNYRHRYKKALTKGADITYTLLNDNSSFDDHLYSLYEQVFNSSRIQVEKLPKAFFQGDISRIIVAKKDERSIAFIQMIENNEELVFAFVGIDYQVNQEYDLYINMLLKMVEYAIDNGFKRIDLGQTADEAKLKLGGHYQTLYAIVHHTNVFLNLFIKLTAKTIEYKPIKQIFNVFK